MIALALASLLQTPDVAELVRRLAHEDPAVRDAATAELLRIGEPALAALREAAKGDDPELVARARRLIAEIDFPEPGAHDHGLALAIRAERDYSAAKPVTLRGRLINVSERDLVVAGQHIQIEGGTFGLDFDGLADLHFCFRPAEPGPSLAERVTIRPGEHVEFTFSPRAWCALIEHSRCGPLQVGPGEHRLTLTLAIGAAGEGEWTGAVRSNEAFVIVGE